MTAISGSSYTSSSAAFGMIRGGHIDVTILGALQCDEKANIANWMVPGKIVRGMGGAMDLVSGVKKVVVAMDHTAKGDHKILESCTLPLTGEGSVDMIITDLAVFEYRGEGKQLTLTEIAPGLDVDYIKQNTGAAFETASDLKVIRYDYH